MQHKLTNINTETMTATCSICGNIQIGKQGSRFRCRTKLLEHSKVKEAKRKQHPKRMKEAFNDLIIKQERRCAICGKLQGSKRMAIDHSHETGMVRGLLCSNCNTGLGLFLDSISNLQAAIEYLKQPQTQYLYTRNSRKTKVGAAEPTAPFYKPPSSST